MTVRLGIGMCVIAAVAGAGGVCVGATLSTASEAPVGNAGSVTIDPAEFEQRVSSAVSRANAELLRGWMERRTGDGPGFADAGPGLRDGEPPAAASGTEPRRRTRPPRPVAPSEAEAGPDEEARMPAQVARLEAMRSWNDDPSLRERWILRTRADALRWFGTPAAVHASGGIEVWRYDLGARPDGGTDRLALRFTATGLMDVDE